MKSTICLAEDRIKSETSLRILLLSINAHWPEATVNLFYPPATGAFLEWVKRCPQVQMQSGRLTGGLGWNIKPQAAMRMLHQGYDEVIWIDSDVILVQDAFQLFANLSSKTLVVAENPPGDSDHNDKDALRARSWGLPVGRVLPFGLNSGVFRVTKEHYSLMKRWWELLQSDVYQDAQRKEWAQRPIHLWGDQDVLTALLTSKEFSSVPLYILRKGKHIVQFDGIWGYTFLERFRNLLGQRPTFIHQYGDKPWSDQWRHPEGLKHYIKKIYVDLSPYTCSARRFRSELGCDTEWMEPHYALSRLLRTLGFGHAPLVGLPMAFAADLARIVIRTAFGRTTRLNIPV
jgi:hypothetical protein